MSGWYANGVCETETIWQKRFRKENCVMMAGFGEVDERFKSHAWKACVG